MSPALASSGASIELALYAGSKWFGSNRVFFPPPPISHGLGMYWPSKKKVNAFSYFIFILVILLVSFD
jgi:hypothetical protein